MSDKIIKVSVRNMVEFILRSGDIDSRYMSSIRAQEGIRIHQKLQKRRLKEALLNNFEYEKEVSLKYDFKFDEYTLQLEGRADGVFRTENGLCVEEIKSTLAPLDSIVDDDNHWHWAQAKCYAFILATQEELSSIKVMLTYMHVETEESVCFETEFTYNELRTFFMELSNKYLEWAKMDYERKVKRNQYIQSIDFPYESYRKGQREFAVYTYNTIKQGKKLFVQAPTGTGKTISTLFPSTKAIGEGLIDKIFYLTAKTITRQTAEDTMVLLSKTNSNLLSITLTAKDKICFRKDVSCNPVDCIYAKGHFDRINEAVWDIVTTSSEMKRQDIEAFAKKHMVCPHEFTLDITSWVDVIICDYNYVFDPTAQLKKFFAEPPKENFLFLIDEAHNLVDRSRDMYSKKLNKNDFLALKKEFKPFDAKLSRLCNKISNYFIDTQELYLGEKNTAIIQNEPTDLYYLLRDFSEKMDSFLAINANDPNPAVEYIVEQYFDILDFLRIFEFFGDKYVVFMERFGKDFSIKLLCLDASEILSAIQSNAVSSIFFSATLTPLNYFRDVLGGKDSDFIVKMPSPFDLDNLCLVIENRISTKYKNRENSYDKIADCIHEIVSAKMGNYLIFFSSYEYLQRVYDAYIDKYDGSKILIQNQNMTEDDREIFLTNFNEDNETSLLAFAVMGGIFSEGIDLKGEKLIGSIIVGVGLPLITPERDVISSHYNQTSDSRLGFEYAYTYPGMNKVLQAAGRVIRTETDKGVVVLIDDRFASSRYLELFPAEWQQYIKASTVRDVGKHLEAFWKK